MKDTHHERYYSEARQTSDLMWKKFVSVKSRNQGKSEELGKGMDKGNLIKHNSLQFKPSDIHQSRVMDFPLTRAVVVTANFASKSALERTKTSRLNASPET